MQENSDTQKRESNRQRLAHTLRLSSPNKRNISLIIILTIGVTLAGVLEPLIIKYIFDQLTADVSITNLLWELGSFWAWV